MLVKLHPPYQNIEYQTITTADGLTNNVIYAVYEDENDFLWMPSDYGIIRLNKQTLQSNTYIEKDGIPHNEFNRTAHHQDKSGTLYFGGLNGIISFHPNDLEKLKPADDAPLAITRFQQFDGESNKIIDKTKEIILQSSIILQPNDKFFSIEMALLEYSDGRKVRYSYQVNTLGDDWNYLSDNTLRLSGLAYGNHILKIKGQSSAGKFSKHELVIPIVVKKPYFLEWWFILTTSLLFISSIFYYYRFKTNALKEQKHELQAAISKATKTIRHQNEDLKKDKLLIEQQADELRDLDEVKSHFFANVSHELRTPLTLLLGPIQSVLNNNKLTNRDFSHLLLAKKNGEKLNKMISEILDLTKLEAGKLEIRLSNTVWYNFLRKSVASFESFANQKNINFTFQYEGSEHLQVALDEQKVDIILMNLLSNAFKFTPQNGQISLIAKNEGQFLILQLTDNGSGIHPEDLPNIFDRFYQTKRKDSAVSGGTGIGLALTKEFIKLMKGQISVESTLGKGTIFEVKLPRIEVVSQIATKDAELIDSQPIKEKSIEHRPVKIDVFPTAEKSQTLLLVEDNLDLRKFLKALLDNQYNVITAENGKEALALLGFDEKSKKFLTDTVFPDLILSDIMMPYVDGYQLLKILKSHPETFIIPTIMLTARGALTDKLKALRIGVDDYMLKPFDEVELLTRVENLLKNASQRKVQLSQNSNTDEEKPTETTTNTPASSKADLEWLANLEDIVLHEIHDSNFVIDDLMDKLFMGRTKLYQKIKKFTGLTPNQYLREVRLTQAKNHLEEGTYTSVKAVGFAIGFKDIPYFSKLFKQRFGKLPSTYIES